MRTILLATCLALPFAGQAQSLYQFSAFEPGCYVPKGSKTDCQPAQLKIQYGRRLVVKTATGDTLRLLPAQVSSFRMGHHQFTTAQRFKLVGAPSGKEIGPSFVEQLDSGRVLLLRYSYDVVTPVPASKRNIALNVSSVTNAYLLHRPGGGPYTPVQNPRLGHGVPTLYDAAKPYFTSRPDLLKALADARTTIDHLPALVRALNSGEPYALPR